jgi:hypothetical protein
MANADENAKPGRKKKTAKEKEPEREQTAEARKSSKAEKAAEAETNDKGPKPSGARDAFSAAIEGLAKLYIHDAEHGVSPQVTDAVTQALTLILGSSPSVVALDGLMSMQTANGIMYYNAVANQQKTNMIGMAMTARCVRHMLGPDHRDPFDETVVVNEEEKE